MKCENIEKLGIALGLQNEVVGIHFLFEDEDFDDSSVEQYKGKSSFCMMVKNACQGKTFKYAKENFGCRCAVEALGVDKEFDCVESGERYYATQLYESLAIAKKTQENVLRINHLVKGIEVAPLKMMEKADICIILADCYQMMRLLQGYTYKYAMPTHISMAGNQGICSDLAARPFVTNDINISLLCSGTRQICKWGKEELGMGMPIQYFDPICEGVINTLNLTEYKEKKDEITKRMDGNNKLGVDINYNISYGSLASKYTKERNK